MITTPIKILCVRLSEISELIKIGYKNRLDDESMNEMINIYNEYYQALQLLGSHIELPFSFARLKFKKNEDSVVISYVSMKNHISHIKKEDKKLYLKTINK